MGSQILKTSPLAAASRVLAVKLKPTSSLSRFLSFPIRNSSSTSLWGGLTFNHRKKRNFKSGIVAMASSVQKSEEEWRAILSPKQFRILRQKGTEYPGIGEYDKFFEEGIYQCGGCGTPLYRSTTNTTTKSIIRDQLL